MLKSLNNHGASTSTLPTQFLKFKFPSVAHNAKPRLWVYSAAM